MASRAVPALTFWRPWPTLILNHGKSVENRSWTTAYRGPLLVHAGKYFDDIDGPLVEMLDLNLAGLHSPQAHPLGLVGIVDVVGVCSEGVFGTKSQVRCSPWGMPGNYHWQLANPRQFDQPIPCRGQQGFWFPPNELLGQVEQAIAVVSRG